VGFGQAEAYLSEFSTKKEERRTTIALESAAVKTLALLVAPIMPDFASRLWQYLGYDSPLFGGTWEDIPGFIPSGRRLGELPLISLSATNVERTTTPPL
jgi:methionyl-tRNA synthetase